MLNKFGIPCEPCDITILQGNTLANSMLIFDGRHVPVQSYEVQERGVKIKMPFWTTHDGTPIRFDARKYWYVLAYKGKLIMWTKFVEVRDKIDLRYIGDVNVWDVYKSRLW